MVTKITIFTALCLLQIPLEFATDTLCFGMTSQIPSPPRQITHSAARPAPSQGWHHGPPGDLCMAADTAAVREGVTAFQCNTRQPKQPAWRRSVTARGLIQSHRTAPNHFDMRTEARTAAPCGGRPCSAPRCPSARAGLARLPLPSSSLGSRVLDSVSDCLARNDL